MHTHTHTHTLAALTRPSLILIGFIGGTVTTSITGWSGETMEGLYLLHLFTLLARLATLRVNMGNESVCL